jgi:hypothetical protein
MVGKKCKGKKRDGTPCNAWALTGSDYCFTHDPEKALERAEARKRGGYNRRAPEGLRGDPGAVPDEIRTIGGVYKILDYTLAGALALENSIARGRLLIALAAEYRAALSVGELEDRVKALEEGISQWQNLAQVNGLD